MGAPFYSRGTLEDPQVTCLSKLFAATTRSPGTQADITQELLEKLLRHSTHCSEARVEVDSGGSLLHKLAAKAQLGKLFAATTGPPRCQSGIMQKVSKEHISHDIALYKARFEKASLLYLAAQICNKIASSQRHTSVCPKPRGIVSK